MPKLRPEYIARKIVKDIDLNAENLSALIRECVHEYPDRFPRRHISIDYPSLAQDTIDGYLSEVEPENVKVLGGFGSLRVVNTSSEKTRKSNEEIRTRRSQIHNAIWDELCQNPMLEPVLSEYDLANGKHLRIDPRKLREHPVLSAVFTTAQRVDYVKSVFWELAELAARDGSVTSDVAYDLAVKADPGLKELEKEGVLKELESQARRSHLLCQGHMSGEAHILKFNLVSPIGSGRAIDSSFFSYHLKNSPKKKERYKQMAADYIARNPKAQYANEWVRYLRENPISNTSQS